MRKRLIFCSIFLLASLALWAVNSRLGWHSIGITDHRGGFIAGQPGSFWIGTTRHLDMMPTVAPYVPPTIPDPGIHWRFLGIGFEHYFEDTGGKCSETVYSPRGSYMSVVQIPYWLVTLLAAIPAAVTIARLRRRTPETHACSSCGYDLRAHGPGGRCPECGTVITALPTGNA